MQYFTPKMVQLINISTNGSEITSTVIPSLELTSASANVCDVEFDVRRWMLVLLCTYFIFGVFGNGILVLLFLVEKNLRTINNAFVTNLAFSDFLFVILFAPIKFFEEYNYLRPFGKTFCYISIIINYTSQDVSTMSMTALSYFRYRAVMCPLQIRQDDQKVKWVVPVGCAISWVVGAAAAVYPAKDCELATDECVHLDMHYVDSFSNNRHHLIFHIVRFVFFYFMPLLVIASLYSKMAFKLCRTPATLQRNDSASARRATRSRKKLGGIILAIVGIFFLSWLPNYLTWFTGLDDNNFTYWLLTMRTVCMFLPSSLNPLILFVTSSGYRKPFLKVFSPWHQSGRQFVRQLRSSSLTTSLTNIRLSRFRRSSSNLPSPT